MEEAQEIVGFSLEARMNFTALNLFLCMTHKSFYSRKAQCFTWGSDSLATGQLVGKDFLPPEKFQFYSGKKCKPKDLAKAPETLVEY